MKKNEKTQEVRAIERNEIFMDEKWYNAVNSSECSSVEKTKERKNAKENHQCKNILIYIHLHVICIKRKRKKSKKKNDLEETVNNSQCKGEKKERNINVIVYIKTTLTKNQQMAK